MGGDYIKEIAEFAGAIIIVTGVLIKLQKISNGLKKNQTDFQTDMNKKIMSSLREMETRINDRIAQYNESGNRTQDAKEKEINARIADLYKELDRFIKKIAAIDEELTGRDGLYVELQGIKKDIESLQKD